MQESKDGTLLLEKDGVKTVVIPVKDKNTVCISTQIGCPMNCAFCRAGKFVRNLTSEEIFDQALRASKLGEVTSVVVMGMGEPMLNFENVSSALEKIHNTFEISYKHITLSTCGLNLEKLENVKYHIAISLHSSNDSIRERLVPGAVSVSEVVDFCYRYTGRYGVMIEYTLIEELNDTDDDLDRLLSYDWPENTNFNLIEFNEYGEYKKSLRLVEWKEKIMSAGYKCFIRHSRGLDIEAACGQLSSPE